MVKQQSAEIMTRLRRRAPPHARCSEWRRMETRRPRRLAHTEVDKKAGKDSEDLKPNPDEVASIHSASFAELVRPGAPQFDRIPESDREVLSMKLKVDQTAYIQTLIKRLRGVLLAWYFGTAEHSKQKNRQHRRKNSTSSQQ